MWPLARRFEVACTQAKIQNADNNLMHHSRCAVMKSSWGLVRAVGCTHTGRGLFTGLDSTVFSADVPELDELDCSLWISSPLSVYQT
jgi:hypothetical protein